MSENLTSFKRIYSDREWYIVTIALNVMGIEFISPEWRAKNPEYEFLFFPDKSGIDSFPYTEAVIALFEGDVLNKYVDLMCDKREMSKKITNLERNYQATVKQLHEAETNKIKDLLRNAHVI